MDLRDIISLARCILLAGAARLQNDDRPLFVVREGTRRTMESGARVLNVIAESIETFKRSHGISAQVQVHALRRSLRDRPQSNVVADLVLFPFR